MNYYYHRYIIILFITIIIGIYVVVLERKMGGKMNKITLTALKKSIKHWEDVVKHPKKTPVGGNCCALCILLKKCTICPIRKKTKEYDCLGTPYRAFRNNRTKANAQKELEFLNSLLPKGEKEK